MSLFNQLFLLGGKDNKLKQYIYHTTGYVPSNIDIYKQSLSHRSKSSANTKNNERLEYLGDSVLNTIISEYLYQKYPYKEEGFLTELRSRIVQRKRLNELAHDIHLHQFMHYEKHNIRLENTDIMGDALEAFIGALYIDKGFQKTKKFVLNKLVKHQMDIEKMAVEDNNFKGQLLMKSQKENVPLVYKHSATKSNGKQQIFVIELYYDEQLICTTQGFNKKDAEQEAAKITLEKLG